MSETEVQVDRRGRRWVRWATQEYSHHVHIRTWMHAPEPGTSSALLFKHDPLVAPAPAGDSGGERG